MDETSRIIKKMYRIVKQKRLSILLVIILISVAITGVLNVGNSEYLEILKERKRALDDVFLQCNYLNVEAVTIKTNLMALDDYLDTMVDEGLMNTTEADTILWKYLYESYYYAMRIVYESRVDLYPEFNSNPNIKIYTTVQDLIDQIDFVYINTDDLLLAISSYQPDTVYITNFNITVIREEIDEFYINNIVPYISYEVILTLAFTFLVFISGVCIGSPKDDKRTFELALIILFLSDFCVGYVCYHIFPQ